MMAPSAIHFSAFSGPAGYPYGNPGAVAFHNTKTANYWMPQAPEKFPDMKDSFPERTLTASTAAEDTESLPRGHDSIDSICLEGLIETMGPCDTFLDDGVQTEAAHPSRTADWLVVWVYERCFKQDGEPIKKAIDDLVAPLGGELVRFRKAKTFEAWAKRCESTKYLLLTDGREAKPCVRIISCEDACAPTRIVVFSEDPKQRSRLDKWATAANEAGLKMPLTVVPRIEELSEVISDAMDDLRIAMKPSSTNSVKIPQKQLCGLSGAAKFEPKCATTPSRSGSTSSGSTPTAKEAEPMLAAPMWEPSPKHWENAGTTFLEQKAAEGVNHKVLKALTPALPRGLDRMQVEMLLTASEPAMYFD